MATAVQLAAVGGAVACGPRRPPCCLTAAGPAGIAAPRRARRAARVLRADAVHKSKKRQNYGRRSTTEDMYISVQPDWSDLWRVDRAAKLIREGAVGILPTDTFPAFVCDLENKDAVRRLYSVKEMNPSKPLSIMVRDFSDIDEYTHGFPSTNIPGRPDTFRVARQCLPGPYTFILAASKSMPKQCLDFQTGRSKHRKSVGVRMPDNPVCQAVLSQLDHPLLVSSVPLESPDLQEFEDEPIVPDPVYMMDVYGPRGVEFVVDAGPYVGPIIGSTVIDMTTGDISVIRVGKGDVARFGIEGP
uniref:Threonylcarbamoyl-AMP synthase n=1 Tax=Tetraselmis sp. GSL018 TaxID=582737 RepID=A0A061S5H6_9CHLO|eukprot:CAMPEP_0177603598 /NCGR_PEP_ID=MMETSP0419_2-20121207/15606_1 /TAXON_ID=582737 /ORGANISM="Tetraselmis sp., Strain GSL018" /LENGTH=300 /DNA_ID=CAMNT_0019097397 /DNA_START=180 /DNA_END=1082 /DNA_ORIENTATION=-